MSEEEIKRFTVPIPASMHARAVIVANRMGISLNDLIRKLLWFFLNQGKNRYWR